MDWPPEASSTFKRTVARANVTFEYISALYDIAGKYNDAPFYSWAAGEVIPLAVDGTYTTGEGWSLTFEFGVNKNEDNIDISPDLPNPPEIISKKGWEYLWIAYAEKSVLHVGIIPFAAECYIKEIFPPVDFSLLEIGT